MRCKSAGCDEEALTLSTHCWDHLPDKEAYKRKLLEAASNKEDLSGYNLKKIILRDSRLEKVNLTKANLSQTNLSGCHLFDSKLQNAELVGADLSNCELTHCDFRGADLAKAAMINSRLWNADLTGANLGEADLSGSDLWNARLLNANLWRTLFVNAKSLTKNNFSAGSSFFDNPRINESGALSAEESYRDLKQYFIVNGRYNDASWASFKEKSMERKILKKKKDPNYLPSLLMSVLCGYGEKPYRIVLSAILTILLFSFLYFIFNTVESSTISASQLSWADYIYYSTITFTTVGYGDFIPKPNGFFRLLAAFEAFTGVFLTGLFIFTLARKYSAR
jgi:uncharacterized protein YjbI with pentapeptide repeats